MYKTKKMHGVIYVMIFNIYYIFLFKDTRISTKHPH